MNLVYWILVVLLVAGAGDIGVGHGALRSRGLRRLTLGTLGGRPRRAVDAQEAARDLVGDLLTRVRPAGAEQEHGESQGESGSEHETFFERNFSSDHT